MEDEIAVNGRDERSMVEEMDEEGNVSGGVRLEEGKDVGDVREGV